ncbi:MAG: CAP domain-containing protein [bacterium]
MKFFRILLILFVIFSIYTMRDDLKIAYVKISTFLNDFNHASSTSSVENTNDTEQVKDKTVNNAGAFSVIKNFKDKISTKNDPLTLAGIISATNRERVSHGLSPLKESLNLDNSAEFKANDMLVRQYFEHQSPDGKGVSDLVENQGYEYIMIGENLALGNFENSDAVVTAWMNSPGHRANILNFRYTEIGVGIVKGNYHGNEVWFAVQHFGLPRNACPFVSETIKNQVENNQIHLATLEKTLTTMKGEVTAPSASSLLGYADKIKSYNKLVDEYNKLVSDTRKLVQEYNDEVKSFNNCAASGN